jgi:hypothetical protein
VWIVEDGEQDFLGVNVQTSEKNFGARANISNLRPNVLADLTRATSDDGTNVHESFEIFGTLQMVLDMYSAAFATVQERLRLHDKNV